MAKEWAEELKIKKLSKINSFEVDGLPAVSAGTTATSNDKPVDVGLAAIKISDSQVYRFMFISPGGASNAEALAAQRTVESFRRLSSAEAAGFRPKRIRVVTASSGDSTASLAREMAVDDLPELQFSVLNGLTPGDRLDSGQTVKLISD